MFMRTKRLFLRPGWTEDFAQVRRGMADWQVARHLARVSAPYDDEEGRARLVRPFDLRAPSLLITLPDAEGAPVIGGCGYGPHADGHAIEVGYWIAREHWGQGYATEAVQGLLAIARMTGLRQLRAEHFLDNPASARVLAKAGFRPTGEIVRRFSLARGAEVPSARFVIDLARAECGGNATMPAAA